jgi:amino acid adenylation domain-containing protein
MSVRHLAAFLLDAARTQPDAAAYRDAAGTRSYAAYRDESLRLAALLSEAGVGGGDRVAIALPKGFALYASLHAALFLNACTVPVDYTTPVERGRAIVTDAGARVLVTTGRNLARLLGDEAAAGVDADAIVVATLASDSAGSLDVTAIVDWAATPERPAALPPLDPEAEAYILYTSGSTGTPKGVVQSQRSATAFAAWAAAALDLSPADVVPQVASVTFDLSVFDVFAATRAGACLVPIHESTMMAPPNFCRAVARSGATVLYCVPSLVLREAKGQSLAFEALRDSALRHIVFAGEPIDKPALRRFRDVIPAVPVHNWFGPTETNVCTAHTVTAADLAADGPVPIGAPCPYASVTIAWDDPGDADGPRTGELLVAGETVLTAYWNRPEETAARIVVVDGIRHYRTGDFVSVNPGGELVFVGRRDRQVKLGGRRVQLDEIEAGFRRHLPALEVACVLVRSDGQPASVAAAIVGEPVPDIDTIREALADALPLWMMPERIVALPALPRNNRGKVDYPRIAALVGGSAP